MQVVVVNINVLIIETSGFTWFLSGILEGLTITMMCFLSGDIDSSNMSREI